MDRDTFEKLQHAAEKRVINQQKKENSYTKAPEQSTGEKPMQNAAPAVPPQPPKSRAKELIGLLNLKNISLDSDRALIMGILLLLANEEADEWLILALIYIML